MDPWTPQHVGGRVIHRRVMNAGNRKLPERLTAGEPRSWALSINRSAIRVHRLSSAREARQGVSHTGRPMRSHGRATAFTVSDVPQQPAADHPLHAVFQGVAGRVLKGCRAGCVAVAWR